MTIIQTVPVKLPGSYPGNVSQPEGYNPSPLPPPTDYYVSRKEVRDLLDKYPIETLMKLVEKATEGNLATLGSDGQVTDSKVSLSVLTTLVGEDPDKSVRKIAEEEVEKVIAEAPDAFDTLKEIADWIKDDESGAAAMAAGIAENSTAIESEVTRATAAETVNANAIAAEVTRATAAETVNANAIAAEVTRAKAAETVNADAITAEVTRAKAAETVNANAITAEVTRATAAETVNANAITAEVTRATAAETVNANAITAEVTRATAAEALKADKTDLRYKLVDQPIGDYQIHDRTMTHIVTENGYLVPSDWWAVGNSPDDQYTVQTLTINPDFTTVLLEDHDFGSGKKTYVVARFTGYGDRFFLCPYEGDYLTVDDVGDVIEGYFPYDVPRDSIRVFCVEMPTEEGAVLEPMINKVVLRTHGLSFGYQYQIPSDSEATVPVYEVGSDGSTVEFLRLTLSEGDTIHFNMGFSEWEQIWNYTIDIYDSSVGSGYYVMIDNSGSSGTPFIPGEYVSGTLSWWDPVTEEEISKNIRILVPDLQIDYVSGNGPIALDFYSKNDNSTPIATSYGTMHVNDSSIGEYPFTGYVYTPCAFGYSGAMIDYLGDYSDSWPTNMYLDRPDVPKEFNLSEELNFEINDITPWVTLALYLKEKTYAYKFNPPSASTDGGARDFMICADLDVETELQFEGDTVKEAHSGALTLSPGRTVVRVTEPVVGELYASSISVPV